MSHDDTGAFRNPSPPRTMDTASHLQTPTHSNYLNDNHSFVEPLSNPFKYSNKYSTMKLSVDSLNFGNGFSDFLKANRHMALNCWQKDFGPKKSVYSKCESSKASPHKTSVNIFKEDPKDAISEEKRINVSGQTDEQSDTNIDLKLVHSCTNVSVPLISSSSDELGQSINKRKITDGYSEIPIKREKLDCVPNNPIHVKLESLRYNNTALFPEINMNETFSSFKFQKEKSFSIPASYKPANERFLLEVSEEILQFLEIEFIDGISHFDLIIESAKKSQLPCLNDLHYDKHVIWDVMLRVLILNYCGTVEKTDLLDQVEKNLTTSLDIIFKQFIKDVVSF